MSALKFTAKASSVYARTAIPSSSGPKTTSLALLWSHRNIVYHHHHLRGWRITPCAHSHSPAHDKVPSSITQGLGLPFWVHHHKSPSFAPVRALNSSSFEKSGVSGAESGCASRSGLVVEMGSDVKDCDDSNNEVLLQKDRLPPSMQDSEQQSKLLTLPTILTLGRVAAVPILIASMCVFVALI